MQFCNRVNIVSPARPRPLGDSAHRSARIRRVVLMSRSPWARGLTTLQPRSEIQLFADDERRFSMSGRMRDRTGSRRKPGLQRVPITSMDQREQRRAKMRNAVRVEMPKLLPTQNALFVN